MLNESEIMEKALKLAEKGRGRTSPNPLVGAVIVNNERIVGEGYHQRAGGSHAEAAAIQDAGHQANGATLYVTLEPCCIEARTPACTDLIIKSGVKEVVIGSLDPNPKVNGRGAAILKKAGVKVRVDDRYRQRVADQNEIFFKYITTGRPFLLAKMALSMDGKITAARGERALLTGVKAKLKVHELRDQFDAIIVGVDTVIVDNPSLTARIEGKKTKNPIRIIVDSRARIPLDSEVVVTAEKTPTFLAVLSGAGPSKLEKLSEYGVNIIEVKGRNKRVDLANLLDWAGGLELTSVLLEGGARLFTGFLEQELIDKFVFFVAPIIMGGAESVDMIGSNSLLMKRLRIANFELVEPDIMIEAYLSRD